MTNQEASSRLRELLGRARTLEFAPVGGVKFFAEEKVVGVEKAVVFGAYARSRGAYTTIEESLLALVCTTEHLGAINRRKQLVLAGDLDPREDLQVLNVLLSSHLHKHNKSPMLWRHRRWLLERYPYLLDLDMELRVIGDAGDRHPLNYYAFAYARWLTSICNQDLERICDWCWGLCYFHIGDTSIWAFLAFCDRSQKYLGRAEAMQAEYNRPAIKGYLSAVITNN